MIVLVCGGRTYGMERTDSGQLTKAAQHQRTLIGQRLAQLPPGTIIIEGGAPGADLIARETAQALGLHCAEVAALWGSYGRSAGHRRNQAMLDLRPELVIAFPGGAGTANCVFQARQRGIRVEEVR